MPPNSGKQRSALGPEGEALLLAMASNDTAAPTARAISLYGHHMLLRSSDKYHTSFAHKKLEIIWARF